MSDQQSELADLWEWFAGDCQGYSPLYSRIASSVARDPEILGLVMRAPPQSHLPLSLLGAVHYLVLDGLDHPLGDVYAGRSQADPAPLFADLCRTHADGVVEVMSARPVQTNECGRSALIGPGLTWISERDLGPLALVDVGASAGLNLLCDQFLLDYGSRGSTGPSESPVVVDCRVESGDPPIADRLPPFASRMGIDHAPVDLSDPDQARWLLACVWPDTGRLDRTRAAIELARADPPEVVGGDANELLPSILRALVPDAVPVVCTTWSFSYFSIEQRERFVEVLSETSKAGPVVWLSGDSAGVAGSFTEQTGTELRMPVTNVLAAQLFHHGVRESTVLASVQPHGGWIEWCATSQPLRAAATQPS